MIMETHWKIMPMKRKQTEIHKEKEDKERMKKEEAPT